MMQTVLIIDDDEAIGNLEQEVLERAGYAVLRAYSGTEARLLLKNERPDGAFGRRAFAAAARHSRNCRQCEGGGVR